MRRSTIWIRSALAIPAVSLLAACQATTPVSGTNVDHAALARAGQTSTAGQLNRQETAPDRGPTGTDVSVIDSSSFPVGTVVDSYGLGVLSEVDTAAGPLKILRISGTPSEMGYQYGRLVGPQIPMAWSALINYLAAESGMTPAQAERAISPLLEKAYKHLEPFIPADFRDEISGIAEGATDVGVTYRGPTGADLATILKNIIALSNTSDLNAYNEGPDAIARILVKGTSAELDAFYKDQSKVGKRAASKSGKITLPGQTCSFFAAWNKRSEGGRMFASRNLDWSADTGIQQAALVTIYAPVDGYAYATFGYAGFVGALAGMNENGITVSEVGSNSVLEKLDGEPWVIRNREILARSANLDEALPLMVNDSSDRVNRPTTLGYNFMVGYGDPKGRGTNAAAAVFETNGGVTSMYYRGSDCSSTPRLYTYGRDGRIARIEDLGASSQVNMETQAAEIDSVVKVRTFKVLDGAYVRDAQGYLIDDPQGSLMPTGKSLECAIYRGDEALGYGARRWQTAANGPSGDDPREALIDSSSYNNRYSIMYGILNALWSGTQYDAKGQTWVQSGEVMRQVNLDSATDIARAAAMDSNILSVVYDATDLKVRVAYETGSGSTWKRAADSPYTDLELSALFTW